MRDPARIPEMCRLLQRAWERVPDLRLGQLVIDAIGPTEPCREMFYAERVIGAHPLRRCFFFTGRSAL
jgi:hypothetical protein